MYQPTAADHTRHANGSKEEALTFFRTRWERLSDRRPRVGVWSVHRSEWKCTTLQMMHFICTNARAHATIAHRLTTAGLRLIPLKD